MYTCVHVYTTIYTPNAPLNTHIHQLKAIYGPSGGPGVGGYVYPKDLGNYSQWWWATVRAETDAVPGLGACGVRWLARSMLTGGTPVVYG